MFLQTFSMIEKKMICCHKFCFVLKSDILPQILFYKKIFIFLIILKFMDKDNYLQKLLSTTPTMEPSIQI